MLNSHRTRLMVSLRAPAIVHDGLLTGVASNRGRNDRDGAQVTRRPDVLQHLMQAARCKEQLDASLPYLYQHMYPKLTAAQLDRGSGQPGQCLCTTLSPGQVCRRDAMQICWRWQIQPVMQSKNGTAQAVESIALTLASVWHRMLTAKPSTRAMSMPEGMPASAGALPLADPVSKASHSSMRSTRMPATRHSTCTRQAQQHVASLHQVGHTRNSCRWNGARTPGLKV
jgi:hypothetical protein